MDVATRRQARRPLEAPEPRPGRRPGHSPTALTIDPAATYKEWCDLGIHIATIHTGSAWWIGDWVVFGKNRWGQRYRQALRATKLEYHTLRNYAWVAAHVPIERRHASLSFQHHAEVAALCPEDQSTWLLRARIGDWSRNRLRREIRAAAAAAQADADGAPARVALLVEPERHGRWLSAAQAVDQTLEDWIQASLDAAADEILAEYVV